MAQAGAASAKAEAPEIEFPTPFIDQDGFALFNASLVYTDDSDRWSIGVHGKNLFNKRYVVAGYDFEYNTVLGIENNITGFYGDPRRFYVTGEVRF